MSSTALVLFRGMKAHEKVVFGNSWGGAARIWSSLFDHYLKDPNREYHSWLMDEGGGLWELPKSHQLSECEIAVLAFTFDNAVVFRADFAWFAQQLRAFREMYPVPETKVDHTDQWMLVFEGCDADAVGLYATSVCENPWYSWDDETEESVPYDLRTGKKHFDVRRYTQEMLEQRNEVRS